MKFRPLAFVSHRVAAAILAAVALTAASGAGAEAASPRDEVQRGFELIDDYVVRKDGAAVAARLYSSSTTRAILIVPGDIMTPAMILWPGSREVESLKSMKVQKLGAGFAEVKKEAIAASHPPFVVSGPKVLFEVNGTKFQLEPKPPLVGLRDAPQMLESSMVYANRAEGYTPSQDLLDKLNGLESRARVRVFFGTWCPACGQMVPRILKVAESLGEGNLAFEFYGLPRGFQGDIEAEKYDIKSVPTGVVLVDGRVVGRIEGNDWRSPESAIWSLLGT